MNNKSFAIDILEEYASSYSKADIDRLTGRLDMREKIIQVDTIREILGEFKKHGTKGDEYFIEFMAEQFGVEIEQIGEEKCENKN